MRRLGPREGHSQPTRLRILATKADLEMTSDQYAERLLRSIFKDCAFIGHLLHELFGISLEGCWTAAAAEVHALALVILMYILVYIASHNRAGGLGDSLFLAGATTGKNKTDRKGQTEISHKQYRSHNRLPFCIRLCQLLIE